MLVGNVLVAHRLYVAASHRMFAGVDANNFTLALTIDHRDVDPVFTAMQTTAFDEANDQNKNADSATTKLLQTEQIALTITLAVSLVGIVALFEIFSVLHRDKLEVDRAITKEMNVLKEASLTDYLTGLGTIALIKSGFGTKHRIAGRREGL